jgi:hypothetical protein
LACIGEPPRSVCRLAERAHASITVHRPVGADRRGISNKLRGLEVRGQTDRLLLLDADILVLGDFTDLSELPFGIAACPANQPRVPERYWQKIYAELELELPNERISSVRGELGCKKLRKRTYAEQPSEVDAMFPYYNAGVIFAPWDCGLRRLWEDNVRKIAALFNPQDEAWEAVAYSDQAGFAVSVQLLKQRGVPFSRLPYSYNANRLHLYQRALRVRDIKFFHAFGSFMKMSPFRRIALGGKPLNRALRHYRHVLIWDMLREWWCQDGQSLGINNIFRYLIPSIGQAGLLSKMMAALYTRHVMPAMQQSSNAVSIRKAIATSGHTL